ncbi:MAG: type II toxin-antitoxin system HigB family toxin [Rhizobacter sp.]|nr:type II toxin-antitoxin system HigB family toxin [Burkholderiales bacterium]
MRVIAVSTLREFWKNHPDALEPLSAWVAVVSKARWSQPADVKAQHKNASILKNQRAVYNIKGNDHRVIVAVAHQLDIVHIKFVGTQKQYDAVDTETVEME